MNELKMAEMIAYQAIEFDRLQKKLEIATQALKEISNWSPWQNERDERAREALKEMEEV